MLSAKRRSTSETGGAQQGRGRHGHCDDAGPFGEAGNQQQQFVACHQPQHAAQNAHTQPGKAGAQGADAVAQQTKKHARCHPQHIDHGRNPSRRHQRQSELGAKQRQGNRHLADIHGDGNAAQHRGQHGAPVGFGANGKARAHGGGSGTEGSDSSHKGAALAPYHQRRLLELLVACRKFRPNPAY